MSDTTLNQYLSQADDSAARTGFVPNPPTPAADLPNGYLCFQRDTGALYAWNSDSTAWVQVGGAGGSIGGSTTQVQFNDAGVFAGDAGLVYDKTTNTLTTDIVDLTATGVSLAAANGVLTILGLGGGVDESLTIDLNTTANEIILGSGSGANLIRWPNKLWDGSPTVGIPFFEGIKALNGAVLNYISNGTTITRDALMVCLEVPTGISAPEAVYGIQTGAVLTGTGEGNFVTGVEGNGYKIGTGDVTNSLSGVTSYIEFGDAVAGSHPFVVSMYVQDSYIASGTIDEFDGLFIGTVQTEPAATITTNYGLFIQDQSGVDAGTTYNMFSMGATAVNKFEGIVDFGFLQSTEMTAPSAPAANGVRIYAEDSGGKTRLMALFSSGAAQQIAIQP